MNRMTFTFPSIAPVTSASAIFSLLSFSLLSTALPRPAAPLLTGFFWAPAAFLLLVRFIDPPFPDRHSTAHRFPVERKRGDSLSEITPLCMLRMRRLIQHRPADHRSSFASETRSPSGPETPAPHRRSRSITPASSRRHIVVAAVALSPASH